MTVRSLPYWFAALLCTLVFAPTSSFATSDGKALFERNKCNECHSISALGVAVVESDDAAADEEDPFGAEEDGEKEDAPDLSSIGTEHDADWIASFLQKKVKKDNGKKHPPRFRGSPDTLKALSEFVAGLKEPAPAN